MSFKLGHDVIKRVRHLPQCLCILIITIIATVQQNPSLKLDFGEILKKYVQKLLLKDNPILQNNQFMIF